MYISLINFDVFTVVLVCLVFFTKKNESQLLSVKNTPIEAQKTFSYVYCTNKKNRVLQYSFLISVRYTTGEQKKAQKAFAYPLSSLPEWSTLSYFLPGGAFCWRTETLYFSASIAKTYPSLQPMYISEVAVQQWAVGCTEVLIQFLGFSMKINKFNQQLTNICTRCYIHFKMREKKDHYLIESDIMFNISIILFSHPFTETSNLTKNILKKSICLEKVVNSLLSLEACLNDELYFQLLNIYF